jgi:hypothetical protein
MDRPVASRGARGACAPPLFGRSVNPISTGGSTLCPPHYCVPSRIFEPCDGPDGSCKKLLLSECNADQLNIFWPFLSSLLGGCNSKATANPPKSDDKNGQEMFNWSELHLERSNFLQNPYFRPSNLCCKITLCIMKFTT